MKQSWLALAAVVAAATLAGCSGSSSQPAYTNLPGIPVGPTPIPEAVYVADPTAGLVEELSSTSGGVLAAVQTVSGLPGMTNVAIAADGQALYAIQPGAISVFDIDQTGETGNLTLAQTVKTTQFLGSAVTGVVDATGGYLLLAGTQDGVTTIAAVAIFSDDTLGTPTSVGLGGVTAAPALTNGITSTIISGTQEAVVVALQTTPSNVVGIGFNGGTFAATPGTAQTVDGIQATGVTAANGIIYASGEQTLDVFNVDAAGDLTVPTGLTGSTSIATQTDQDGINSSVAAGSLLAQQSAVTVGYSNAGNGLATVLLNADGSLSTVQDFTVFGSTSSTGPVGVNAVTTDASGLVFTANSGGSADALVFSSLTAPVETTPVATSGQDPTSITTVQISSSL